MKPVIDAILDPGTPPTVRYPGPFQPPWSRSERAVGVGVLLMATFVLASGIGAVWHLINLIRESGLS